MLLSVKAADDSGLSMILKASIVLGGWGLILLVIVRPQTFGLVESGEQVEELVEGEMQAVGGWVVQAVWREGGEDPEKVTETATFIDDQGVLAVVCQPETDPFPAVFFNSDEGIPPFVARTESGFTSAPWRHFANLTAILEGPDAVRFLAELEASPEVRILDSALVVVATLDCGRPRDALARVHSLCPIRWTGQPAASGPAQ